MGYQKFCYWMDLRGLRKVRNSFEERGIPLTDEALIPCRVLRSSMEISYLAPPAWKGFCKRRTSWYRKSEKAGKFLIVSNTPFDHLDLGNPVIIKESNFKPDRLPTGNEISQLAQSKEFQNRKPTEWDKPEPIEKEFYQRWFERQGSNGHFDFDKIFISHSANHANFINPIFFTIVDDSKAPYSIADSIHVCSSCLEFFSILGNQWPVKYVVPCIGAVQFAHLTADRYFEVKTST
ncbi:MAG: hypothetical protein AB1502_04000 [Thermodesulfobacteriota bacterium]